MSAPITINPAQKIPGSVVKAIGIVQSTIEAVKKSQENKHGGYKFASTDDIYAAITAKMGEAGLTIVGQMEGKPEIETIKAGDGKITRWLSMEMNFVVATQEDTWDDPRNRRYITVPITGPQTFQAAQSYLEKSFLRSIFKIPTGDVDIDALPEGFDYAPHVRPMAPPPAPAAPAAAKAEAPAGESGANPAEDVRGVDADAKSAGQPMGEEPPAETEAPAIDWAEQLAILDKTLGKMKTHARLDEAVERFNAAHDGQIPRGVVEDIENLYATHGARLRRENA